MTCTVFQKHILKFTMASFVDHYVNIDIKPKLPPYSDTPILSNISLRNFWRRNSKSVQNFTQARGVNVYDRLSKIFIWCDSQKNTKIVYIANDALEIRDAAETHEESLSVLIKFISTSNW